MTLYRYVPSKDALLDGVVARVPTDLAINPAAADWRQELRDLATSFRSLALAHPNAVPLLVTRPLASPLGQRPPATLRPLENFPELLIRAGFSPADALHAYRLFFGIRGYFLRRVTRLQRVITRWRGHPPIRGEIRGDVCDQGDWPDRAG
jgi:AcrR family transcriptional regulator